MPYPLIESRKDMKNNYHTHTVRCRHAQDTEREYIEAAIAAGITTLGFADHAPQIFPGDYYSHFRMRPEELEDYCRTLRALKEEYKDRIDIKIGLEAEYYPALFADLIELIRPYDLDYLILGQHLDDNEIGLEHNFLPTDKEEHLIRHTSQVLRGLSTGYFTYLAHPDLVNFTGDDETYRRHMLPFCRAIKEMDIPLEVNILGLTAKRNYPSERFYRIAAEVGNRFVLGIDAHTAGALSDPAGEAMAREFCRKVGITPEEDVKLIPPTRK